MRIAIVINYNTSLCGRLVGICRSSGSKIVFIVYRREETQRHESHVIRIFVTFVCLCAPYTHAVYIDTHCMLACIYEMHTVGGRLQIPALMVGICSCIRRASSVPASSYFRCERTDASSPPPASQYFAMEIVISSTIDVSLANLRCQLIV